MTYEVITDAPVLLPNADHQNFTTTDEIIPKGAQVEGAQKLITGLRRGKPFQYRLFITNDKKLIHLNKVKPMEATEVKLGADGATPTTVKIESKKIVSVHTVAGVVIGSGSAYLFSRSKKYGTQKTLLVTAIGGLVGYIVGRQMEKKGILVKPSK